MNKIISTISLSLLLLSCSSIRIKQDSMISQSQKIAQESLIVDTHIDTPIRLFNYPLDVSQKTQGGHFDYPRARSGGLNLAFMSLFVPDIYDTDIEYKDHAMQLLEMVKNWLDKAPDKFTLVRSSADTLELLQNSKVGLAMGLENGAAIGKDLSNIGYFSNLGVSYVTLTHSKNNQIGDSSGEDKAQWNGLSPFGRQAVIEMQKQGVMIDVSHVSDSTFFQVIDLVDVPVIASHSSCRELTPEFKRNMSDDMLEALAKNGGVIQINFGSSFLKPEYKSYNDKIWHDYEAFLSNNNAADYSSQAAAYLDHWQSVIKLGTVKDLVDHIDHAVKIAGIDHVGLGSDFDGVIITPTNVADVSDYPIIIAELLTRGYLESDIKKILSGNLMRVWQQVEAYSRELIEETT